MSAYAEEATKLLTDPSTHGLALALGWLALRVEQLHRRVGSRLRRFARRIRKVERAASLRAVRELAAVGAMNR